MEKFDQSKEGIYLERTAQLAKANGYENEAEMVRCRTELDKKITEADWDSEGIISFSLESTEQEPRVDFQIEYDSNMHGLVDSPGHFKRISKNVLDFRRIKNFRVENGGYFFDLRELIGDEYDVFIVDDERLTTSDDLSKKETSTAFFDRINKIIVCGRSPLTYRGLLSFFHEVGHVVEDQALSPEEIRFREEGRKKDWLGIETTTIEKKSLIAEERGAAAFQLEAFHRLLSQNLPSSTINMIKKETYHMLNTYHCAVDTPPGKRDFDDIPI